MEDVDDDEEDEPEPHDVVDLLVQDVERQNAESLSLLNVAAGTVIFESAGSDLNKKNLLGITEL